MPKAAGSDGEMMLTMPLWKMRDVARSTANKLGMSESAALAAMGDINIRVQFSGKAVELTTPNAFAAQVGAELIDLLDVCQYMHENDYVAWDEVREVNVFRFPQFNNAEGV